ncbi:MAG: ligase-associated DNA damage response exonuclease [Henriciella sp.]
MITPEHLLRPTPSGLYCPPGDFYIDPVRRAVDRAIITHGHADHARAGHGAVLATPDTLAIMAARYGANFCSSQQALAFGETVSLNGVKIGMVPAGHILGSAQIILEWKGLRIVNTGDYKRRLDPTCTPFEVVSKPHVFITEATFGLPVFKHPDDRGEISRLLASLKTFSDRPHLIGVYSLGKAQRVIRLLRDAGWERPIYIHGALEKLCELYVSRGVTLGPLEKVRHEPAGKGHGTNFAGEIILGPPSAFAAKWGQRFKDPILGFASGWMGIRQRTRQRGVELPLILSDHADWDELTNTIIDVDAEEVWITYGREDALVRWSQLNGRRAKPLRLVGYSDENDDSE